MKTLAGIIAFLIFLAFVSCDKMPNSKTYARQYNPFLLSISDSKQPINLFDIQLYWFENGEKKFRENSDSPRVIYPFRYFEATNEYKRDSLTPLFCSKAVFRISAELGVRTFYLAYGNGTSDTLDVEWSNDAGSFVAHRGTTLPLDTSFSFPVYMFKRD